MNIISRAEWGGPTTFVKADESPGAWPVPLSKREGVCFHWDGKHAVLGAPYDQVMVKLQALHKRVEGGSWGGVGYNYVITGDGRAWEGRGIGLTAVACPNRNTAWVHIQLHIGQGDDGPTVAQLASAARLADWIDEQVGRPLPRYVHRDGWPTVCAGPDITKWVRDGCPVAGLASIDDQEDLLSKFTREDLIDIQREAILGIKWGDQTYGARFAETYRLATFIPQIVQQLGDLSAAVIALSEGRLDETEAAALKDSLDRNTIAIHALVKVVGLDRAADEAPADVDG